jgi:hypothetical protein
MRIKNKLLEELIRWKQEKWDEEWNFEETQQKDSFFLNTYEEVAQTALLWLIALVSNDQNLYSNPKLGL